MRCKTVLRLTDDHVDGLLPARSAEQVRQHLDACADCREETEAARAASTSLAAWGDLEPPPACFESILARIEHLPADAHLRGRRRRLVSFRHAQWLATSGLAAAAAILIGVSFSDFSPQPMRLHQPMSQSDFRVVRYPGVPKAANSMLTPSPRVGNFKMLFNTGLRKRRVFVPASSNDTQPEGALPPGEGPR